MSTSALPWAHSKWMTICSAMSRTFLPRRRRTKRRMSSANSRARFRTRITRAQLGSTPRGQLSINTSISWLSRNPSNLPANSHENEQILNAENHKLSKNPKQLSATARSRNAWNCIVTALLLEWHAARIVIAVRAIIMTTTAKKGIRWLSRLLRGIHKLSGQRWNRG